jgi:peptidoglycan/LPS O-acetylase OafA/YrhL
MAAPDAVRSCSTIANASARSATESRAQSDGNAVLEGAVHEFDSTERSSPLDTDPTDTEPGHHRRTSALDGIRAFAVLAVMAYHFGVPGTSGGLLGVDVFFVLSGFLITSLICRELQQTRTIRLGRFWAQRARRLLPALFVLLIGVALYVHVFAGSIDLASVRGDAFATLTYVSNWRFILSDQGYFALAAAPSPFLHTWSLAIEEQYYFLWAPIVRFLRRPWMLATVLTVALVGSPLLRLANLPWMTLTNTLIHLDGIALGSLLALGFYTLTISRRVWLWIGLGALALGIAAAATIAGGTSFLDSALATGFAGAMLAAIASTGSLNPVNAVLRRGPLAFYGRISYGLYMTHIMAFIFLGWFDLWMDRYGMAGSLAVVVARFAVSTALAATLWYGFESRILKLKRYF